MVRAFAAVAALPLCAAFIPHAPVSSPASVAPRSRGVTNMAEKSKSIPFLPRPEALDGTAPGDVGFDPVGFTTWLPLPYLQEAEIKHCRVAMLAVLGYVVADFFKLPGDIHQISSLEAHDVHVKSGALAQVLIWTSVLEIIDVIAIAQMLEGSGRKPGDFKFDPLGFAKDDKTFKDMQLKEIKNGRLAMLAFSGIVTQNALTGHGFPYL